MSCREHVSQLRQQQGRLDELNIEVKIVVFDNDFMARAYAADTKLNWPLLLDADRQLYSSYGMTRGSWWAIYNPFSIAKYLWLIILGTRPGKPGNDWRQMGGDVLIDPGGVVRIHYVSTDPHDRVAIEKIFEAASGQ